MKFSPHSLHLARRAFTLIETLVVVSIIVLILALTAPSLFSTMQATKLTTAGETVLGFLSEAQQVSQSQNAPIEVRFFKYQTALSNFEAYRSMQMFKITHDTEDNGQITEVSTPLGNLIRLPEGTLIPIDEQDLSPLLNGEGFTDENPNGGTYSGTQDATYNAIRFMTDGTCRIVSQVSDSSTSLSFPELQKSCITMCPDIGQEVKVDNLPKNFYCIQIDPYTGKMRTYGPGQN